MVLRSGALVWWLMGLVSVGAPALACPDYLTGEYRKLHSKDNVDLCALTKNKTVLIVNTASHCGFTPQFKELEALHQQYREKGLVIVGFASDDFKQEANNEEEAAGVCFLNYGVTFTMLAPTHVRGDQANKVFTFLAKESSAPKWNFNKYLIGKDGKFIEHFGSMTKPNAKELIEQVAGAL